jgi:hypothetical protein
MMLAVFGNETAGKVLLCLQNYGEGCARAIGQTYSLPRSMVQKQLLRLESEGVLVSQLKGRTRHLPGIPATPCVPDSPHCSKRRPRFREVSGSNSDAFSSGDGSTGKIPMPSPNTQAHQTNFAPGCSE